MIVQIFVLLTVLVSSASGAHRVSGESGLSADFIWSHLSDVSYLLEQVLAGVLPPEVWSDVELEDAYYWEVQEDDAVENRTSCVECKVL